MSQVVVEGVHAAARPHLDSARDTSAYRRAGSGCAPQRRHDAGSADRARGDRTPPPGKRPRTKLTRRAGWARGWWPCRAVADPSGAPPPRRVTVRSEVAAADQRRRTVGRGRPHAPASSHVKSRFGFAKRSLRKLRSPATAEHLELPGHALPLLGRVLVTACGRLVMVELRERRADDSVSALGDAEAEVHIAERHRKGVRRGRRPPRRLTCAERDMLPVTADTDRIRASSPIRPELRGVAETELVVGRSILQDDPGVLAPYHRGTEGELRRCQPRAEVLGTRAPAATLHSSPRCRHSAARGRPPTPLAPPGC